MLFKVHAELHETCSTRTNFERIWALLHLAQTIGFNARVTGNSRDIETDRKISALRGALSGSGRFGWCQRYDEEVL